MPKHIVSLCIIFLMMPSMVASAHGMTHHALAEYNGNTTILNISEPKVITVHLKKVYLDGFKTERVVNESILSMDDFWSEYEHWQLVKQTHHEVYFQKNINDISPVSKAAGIFGLSNHQTLTIFKGNPNDDQIIKTFFQIDIDALQASLQSQLKQGIPVKSKENFRQVMSVLKHYKKVTS